MLALLLVPATARAGELVPPDLAAKTLLRALAYDRGLKGRGATEVVVAVLSKEGHGSGDGAAFLAALKALGNVTVQDLPLKVVALGAASGAEASSKVVEARAQVLYVGDGFARAEVEVVQTAAAKAQCITTYRTPDYEEVLALGVLPREGKMKIVVKLAAAKAAGADLDAQLLKLAQVK
jgi:YfiR/HmsC-like